MVCPTSDPDPGGGGAGCYDRVHRSGEGLFPPGMPLRCRVRVYVGRECAMDLYPSDRVVQAMDHEPALLKALILTIPDMVWLKDPAGVFLTCNSATAKFLDKPESEVVGKTDYDFFPAEEAELYRARDRQAAASQG